MLTKHLCVLIDTRIKGWVGTVLLLRYSVACTVDHFSFIYHFLYVLGNGAFIYEPQHGISKNVVYATSKGSDQPAHTRSLIRAFASCLNVL